MITAAGPEFALQKINTLRRNMFCIVSLTRRLYVSARSVGSMQAQSGCLGTVDIFVMQHGAIFSLVYI